MSLSNILKATASMVMEAKMNAIDMFVEFMREKIEIDDEFMEFVKEFKNTVNEDDVELSKSKKKGGEANAPKVKNVIERKRPPTAYHVFMSETSARLREENPDMSKKEVQDEAKKLWKEKKEAEPKEPRGNKKGKKSNSADTSESVAASDEETAANTNTNTTDDDDSSEDVVQRIKAAVEKEKKSKAPRKNSKKKISELVDELTSDE